MRILLALQSLVLISSVMSTASATEELLVVVNSGENTVALVNPERPRQSTKLRLASSNELVIFAAAQRRVIRHIPTGRFSKGLLILPDGEHGFVSAMEENEVVEVDVVTGRVVQRMRTGTAPEGLAWISHSQTTESQTRLRRQSGQVLPKK